ncbi:MAG TPA: SusD/RagB family nutrient-binding outer membrane lipoprotein [Haliscomenobacter sp.]|nr:SusD/RagB family nutrient-binding outer membrane lipoprotein [Haliscomenobacter sp.]
MKRFMFNKSALVFVTGLFLASSCDITDFGDTNVSPNATSIPITSALLTNAINGTFNTATLRDVTAGAYAQYVGETQYTEASLYTFSNPAWDGQYAGALYDLQNVINNNTDPATAPVVAVNGSNANQIAVARIVKAYRFWCLTDDYGDIPYSGALKGESQVPYDSQADIYKDLFKELKEAVAQFDGGLAAKGDILYNGNIAKWKKFANSIRLVMALRVSKADATLGKAEAASAIAAGVIEANADNAVMSWPGGAFKNTWFNLYDGRKDYAISDVIVNFMSPLNDPRLLKFGTPNGKGEIVPMPYGLTRDLAVAYTNSHPDFSFILDAPMRAQNSPQTILSAGQVYLARAEAAQLGWTAESASAMYAAGIKASWQEWGVFDQAKYDAYLQADGVTLASGDVPAKIGLQRWLSFYPNGSQGWYEWRRTGYPNLKPTQYATNSSKQIPVRYAYPATEPNFNGAAYTAAVGRLTGGDTQDAKVWWDK